MADLRTSPGSMRELLSHLETAEDVVPCFYCDDHGLVTIASGRLIDERGASDSTGKRIATDLALRYRLRFSKPQGVVSGADIESDWQRVKDYGRAHPRVAARRFASVAQLRIDNASIRNLTEVTVRKFADQLYGHKPDLVNYDPRVAMALVDVRYDAAGVKLYGSSPPIREMWAALDPYAESFNMDKAVETFERIWAGRGPARYGLRHYQRVKWLRAGLLAMGGSAAPQSA